MSKVNINKTINKNTRFGWIPDEWVINELGSLGEILNGLTYSPSNISNHGILVLRSSNIKNRQINLDDSVFVNTNNLKYNKVVKNDILICVRNGSKRLIGKNAMINEKHEGMAFGAFMTVFRSRFADFLFQYFGSDLFYRNVHRNLGATINSINNSDLKKFKVACPPINEQNKIAEILSTWDDAIKKTENLIEKLKLRKKGLMQQLLTGKTRLAGFEGEWSTSDFNEIYFIDNDKSKQLKKSEYKPNGEYPIVDQSKSLIVGYTDRDNLYSKVPTIVFGDHTREVKYIDFKFVVGADGTQLIKTFEELDLKYGYYLLDNIKLPNLGYSRHLRELRLKVFDYPNNLNEQKEIAEILTQSDNEIELHEKKLGILRDQKKGLMQKLLTGEVRVKK